MSESDVIGENLSTNINFQVRPLDVLIDNTISTSMTEMSESYLDTSDVAMTLSEPQAGEINIIETNSSSVRWAVGASLDVGAIAVGWMYFNSK